MALIMVKQIARDKRRKYDGFSLGSSVLIILSCMLFSCNSFGQQASCQKDEELQKFLDFGDVFFGELHGTVEIPHFIKCLVEKGLEQNREKMIISLEMRPEAVDQSSLYWKENNMDGRASLAMLQLVSFVAGQERLGLLKIHFQRPKSYEQIGRELLELSKEGQVIVLSGNVHSLKSKSISISEDFISEGMLVGPSFTHISITSAAGGEMWGCVIDCGIQKIPAQENAADLLGELKDGMRYGHDYIYFLNVDKFTFSPPLTYAK